MLPRCAKCSQNVSKKLLYCLHYYEADIEEFDNYDPSKIDHNTPNEEILKIVEKLEGTLSSTPKKTGRKNGTGRLPSNGVEKNVPPTATENGLLGLLDKLSIKGQKVSNLKQLHDLCYAGVEELIEVLWNGDLIKWLVLRGEMDLVDEVVKVKEEYKLDRLLGAHKWLWLSGEQRLLLKSALPTNPDIGVTSLEELIKNTYLDDFENASLEVLKSTLMKIWLSIVIKDYTLEIKAVGNELIDLWKFIWETPSHSSLLLKPCAETIKTAYLKSKKLLGIHTELWFIHYQHAKHCSVQLRLLQISKQNQLSVNIKEVNPVLLKEMEDHLEKALINHPPYQYQALNDPEFNHIKDIVKSVVEKIGKEGNTDNIEPQTPDKPIQNEFEFIGPWYKEEYNSISNIIDICENFPNEVMENLQEFINVIRETFNQSEFAAAIENKLHNYTDKRKQLELFVRELLLADGKELNLQLTANPTQLDFGEIQVNTKHSQTFTLQSSDSRYIWGTIAVELPRAGIVVPNYFECDETEGIEVIIDTSIIKKYNRYRDTILVYAEDTTNVLCRVELCYKVIPSVEDISLLLTDAVFNKAAVVAVIIAVLIVLLGYRFFSFIPEYLVINTNTPSPSLPTNTPDTSTPTPTPAIPTPVTPTPATPTPATPTPATPTPATPTPTPINILEKKSIERSVIYLENKYRASKPEELSQVKDLANNILTKIQKIEKNDKKNKDIRNFRDQTENILNAINEWIEAISNINHSTMRALDDSKKVEYMNKAKDHLKTVKNYKNDDSRATDYINYINENIRIIYQNQKPQTN